MFFKVVFKMHFSRAFYCNVSDCFVLFEECVKLLGVVLRLTLKTW